MKLMHTADLHLQVWGDERWQALEKVLALARRTEVDILTISGDLFHGRKEGIALRSRIQDLFSNQGFKILIIPGNHDKDVFDSGQYLGNDATVLLDLENPLYYEGVCFYGFPYEALTEREILDRLHGIKDTLSEGVNILLYHGELLDAFMQRNDFGQEGKQRYMPVSLSSFQDSGFDYVLAGHFHTSFQIFSWDKGHFFVYPGSPVSVTRRETGERRVCVLDVGSVPQAQALSTPFYHEITLHLNPYATEDPIQDVKDELNHLPTQARCLLKVQGYYDSKKVGWKEKELVERIQSAVEGRCSPYDQSFSIQDVSEVLYEDLFQDFSRRLQARDLPQEKKENILNLVLRAMLEVGG